MAYIASDSQTSMELIIISCSEAALSCLKMPSSINPGHTYRVTLAAYLHAHTTDNRCCSSKRVIVFVLTMKIVIVVYIRPVRLCQRCRVETDNISPIGL